MARLIAVVPISDEDVNALPVKALDQAIEFYRTVLGFSVADRNDSVATLSRDEVKLGLVVNRAHQPKQAGSLAFEVDDLEAMHRELQRSGGQPGEFGTDEWGGRWHRTFFVREAENGYCFCYYHSLGSVKP